MALMTRTVSINPAFLQEIKEDHHELRQLMHHAAAMLNRPGWMRVEYGRLFDLFDKLRDQLAMHFALEKARSIQSPDAVVIGSDTVVVLDDVVLGKPVDLDDARRMLTMLRGRTHRVVTAVAVLAPSRTDQVWCKTASVTMRAVDDGEIDAYLRMGESMDKAGAYALQGEGGRLIETINGDRFVVIGLPLRSVADALRRCGIPVAVDVDAVYATP